MGEEGGNEGGRERREGGKQGQRGRRVRGRRNQGYQTPTRENMPSAHSATFVCFAREFLSERRP